MKPRTRGARPDRAVRSDALADRSPAGGERSALVRRGYDSETKQGSTVIQPLPEAPFSRPVEFWARVYQDST